MSTTVQNYAVYYTAATGSYAAGYVWNVVAWDGTSTWSPPTGSKAVLDTSQKYPIGSTYSGS